MFTKKRRRKASSSGQSMTIISEAFQQNLLKDLQMDSPVSEHTMSLEQLSDLHPLSRIYLNEPTKSQGLKDEEASIRLSSSERNVIGSLASNCSQWKLFLAQFLNTFRMLLLFAALICLLIFSLEPSDHVNELAMSGILFGVLFILCIASYLQEKKTLEQIRNFQTIVPQMTHVIREGRELKISSADVVVGDLVWIRTGDRVPADIRLMYVEDLYLETSWISGEIEPLEYTDESALKGTGVFEAQNIAFKGCSCTSGQGFGIVIRTGNKTVIGSLVQMASKEKSMKSRLEVEHNRFVRLITFLSFAMATVTFLIGFAITGLHSLIQTFVNGFLVIVVANVPQGLSVTLTAQLIIVARRLAKYGLQLKRLDTVDTLGITTTLLTDKTGMFTTNDLRVTDLWCQRRTYMSKDLMDSRNAHKLVESLAVILGVGATCSTMLTIMSVCGKAQIKNSAHLKRDPNVPSFRQPKISQHLETKPNFEEKRPSKNIDTEFSLKHKDLYESSVVGKPTDVALVKFVEQITDAQKLREQYEVVFEVPFSGQRRYHLVIACDKSNRSKAGNDEVINFTLMAKGAPEEIIQRCRTIASDRGEEEIDDDKAFLKFCSEGKSCLGFAKYEFESFADTQFFLKQTEWNFPMDGWTFVGISAQADPLCTNITETVESLENAGVRLFLVTGDHPATAEALARQVHEKRHGDTVSRNTSAEEKKGSIQAIHEKAASEHTRNSSSGSHQSDVDSTEHKSSAYGSGEMTDISSLCSLENLSMANWSYEVVHGEFIQKLADEDWKRIFGQRFVIFARTTPSQRMFIVEKCQANGELVTSIGDGILDAPALKQADVGIALEAVGSAFAKEASDIILSKNDLANVVKGIAQARLLFDNLKKTITYTLSHLLPELLPVLLTFILGFPQGLTSIQVLTIDLMTEIPPSIALIFEPTEKDIMKRPPRRQNAHLVTKSMLVYSYLIAGNLISLGCVLAYFSVFWYHGLTISDLAHTGRDHWNENAKPLNTTSGLSLNVQDQLFISKQAHAAWQITLVISQIFNLWSCTTRRMSIFRHGFKNWMLHFAVLLEICGLLLFVFVPGMNSFIGMLPPPGFIWIFSIVVGVLLIVLGEIRKYFIRRMPQHPIVRVFKW